MNPTYTQPADVPVRARPPTLSWSERVKQARYKWFPDHLLGEVLAKRWIDNAAPFFFLIATVCLFGTLLPDLFAPASFTETLRQFGEIGLLVLAMSIVLIGGGIDLSIGSNFALANFCTLALTSIYGVPLYAAAPIAIAAGAAVGLVNGILVGYLRLRAFLTTLVTLILLRSVVEMLLLSRSVEITSKFVPSAAWDVLGLNRYLGMPVSLIIFVVVAAFFHIYLSRLKYGWRIMAAGGSRRSAHNIGINVKRTICSTYVISGALTGLAGYLYAARLSSLNTDAGSGLEVVALTAAVLGGTSLGGGRGSVAKAAMGAATVVILTSGVVRLGLSSGAGQAVLGLMLAFAVAVDVRWVKNRDKVLSKVYVSPTFVAMPEAPKADVSGSPYAINTRLRSSDAIGLGEIEGPEDVILDRQGNLYTGTRLGDIVRFFGPDFARSEVFCHIGGHPLGMSFAQNGDLYVCVGGMGVYAIDQAGVCRKLTDETNRSAWSVVDDSRLRLPDDLDIAPDGKVYFSEATVRYEMHTWPVDALEGRGNGRIICYDPETNRTKTVLRNLVFPNGMCLSHDGMSIFFAESWLCRISRYWISGPKAGQVEVVIPALPGYPDNINRASDGTYWLAIMGMRGPALDLALKMPDFRKRMARRLPEDEWLYPNINTGCIVKFNAAGQILETLWDFGGESHPMITSMREDRGHLYIGGITNNRIGRLELRGANADWTGYDSYWQKS
ncbi:SMP-30/gluconolactonase/LRE family protein [Variovorax sp. E3]|uniref:ABC transporter permease n=1 Tax=Variovorax sp. E3 TaxID=1914993 RepID=UPI0018DB678D|nr:SMP-30/gluconolactonase/LRE family protein [Variovorax sp. E3]